MKPIINYDHAGYDENKNALTSIFADGLKVAQIKTPGKGISTSYQENELSAVEETVSKLFPEGFSLPYYVDNGSGYVYKKSNY